MWKCRVFFSSDLHQISHKLDGGIKNTIFYYLFRVNFIYWCFWCYFHWYNILWNCFSILFLSKKEQNRNNKIELVALVNQTKLQSTTNWQWHVKFRLISTAAPSLRCISWSFVSIVTPHTKSSITPINRDQEEWISEKCHWPKSVFWFPVIPRKFVHTNWITLYTVQEIPPTSVMCDFSYTAHIYHLSIHPNANGFDRILFSCYVLTLNFSSNSVSLPVVAYGVHRRRLFLMH